MNLYGIIVSIIAVLLLIYIMLINDTNEGLKAVFYRHFLARVNSGKIKNQSKAPDFINHIADEMEALDQVFFKANYNEPNDIGPAMWAQGRDHMAGIVLAISAMAEFYDVDIIDEIILKVNRDGEKRNKL